MQEVQAARDVEGDTVAAQVPVEGAVCVIAQRLAQVTALRVRGALSVLLQRVRLSSCAVTIDQVSRQGNTSAEVPMTFHD